MGKEMLAGFVEAGYLDASVTGGFDPYYEPSWLGSGSDAGDAFADDEEDVVSDGWFLC